MLASSHGASLPLPSALSLTHPQICSSHFSSTSATPFRFLSIHPSKWCRSFPHKFVPSSASKEGRKAPEAICSLQPPFSLLCWSLVVWLVSQWRLSSPAVLGALCSQQRHFPPTASTIFHFFLLLFFFGYKASLSTSSIRQPRILFLRLLLSRTRKRRRWAPKGSLWSAVHSPSVLPHSSVPSPHHPHPSSGPFIHFPHCPPKSRPSASTFSLPLLLLLLAIGHFHIPPIPFRILKPPLLLRLPHTCVHHRHRVAFLFLFFKPIGDGWRTLPLLLLHPPIWRCARPSNASFLPPTPFTQLVAIERGMGIHINVALPKRTICVENFA